MRRLSAVVGSLFLAGGFTVAAGLTPAHAQCPAGDGTVPGSGSTVTAVGLKDSTPYGTIYVDDRDYADADDDGNAGGIWLYIETNSVRALQRGGDQVAFSFVNPNVPLIPGTQVLPPNPGGAPVFPNGVNVGPLGGGSLAELAGGHDACKTDQSGAEWLGAPDSILF